VTTLAILPIKDFDHAKQRLGEALNTGPRQMLVQAMFSDVLIALNRSARVDDILVVTEDHGAERIAAGYGALVVSDHQQGHNPAAARGLQRALELGVERALLVPGDCPLMVPAEIDALIDRAPEAPSALIIPDRHGSGTNALLLTPPDVMAPAFGPGSRTRHEALAEKAQLRHETVDIPSLGLDIDTPEDLAAAEAALDNSHGGAAHTRGMLRQLARSWS
jgi:2-phospho-L-lactate/phosphoenolpyruvate guanylyltransferase